MASSATRDEGYRDEEQSKSPRNKQHRGYHQEINSRNNGDQGRTELWWMGINSICDSSGHQRNNGGVWMNVNDAKDERRRHRGIKVVGIGTERSTEETSATRDVQNCHGKEETVSVHHQAAEPSMAASWWMSMTPGMNTEALAASAWAPKYHRRRRRQAGKYGIVMGVNKR
jgi:hypothetical protein